MCIRAQSLTCESMCSPHTIRINVLATYNPNKPDNKPDINPRIQKRLHTCQQKTT